MPGALAGIRMRATLWLGRLCRQARVALLPIDVDEVGPSTFYSGTSRPWLQLTFEHALPAGRWVSISYSASLYDELVRPMIRFDMPDGELFDLLPAPLFGRATWIGYVPLGTTRIHISPVERSGCFGFRLDAFSILPPGWPTFLALMKKPRLGALAMVAACRGARPLARELIWAAIRSCPFESYDSWRLRRTRIAEPDGLERPRGNPRDSLHIRAIIHAPDDASETSLGETLVSLSRQFYSNWSLAVVATGERWSALESEIMTRVDGRAAHFLPDSPVSALCADLPADAMLAPLVSGAVLPPYGLSVLAEYSRVHADCDVVYADEDHVDHRGKLNRPLFKPDWSPVFQQSSSYIGRAVYLRRSAFAPDGNALSSDVCVDGAVVKHILASTTRVGHVRRVLLTSTPASTLQLAEPVVPARRLEARHVGQQSTQPRATVVIPSKDRADLLEACWSSLSQTQPANFEVVVVDNGSENAETIALYDRMKADPRVRICCRPGAFNFAELCNAAAEVARTSVLVFLNNDVVVRTGWLDTMIMWALRSDVGAVGTTLLYPSGRIQHAGVVVGLAGYAAHIERESEPYRPGYMARLSVAREVSAVTAACLAVEKSKFDAVGGFDERTFPIELNDVDLCLRLIAAGWATICLAEPTMVHHESATRGAAQDMDVAYGHERREFKKRWSSSIRDDPYFHPALSLHAISTSLDQ